MEGRINEETENFEVLRKHKWVILDDDVWFINKTEISNSFLITIYSKADSIFKERALCELKRRIKFNFNLKLLWEFSLGDDRLLGDLALNEIFERSGGLLLPHYKNK